jgi:hypothetical protein
MSQYITIPIPIDAKSPFEPPLNNLSLSSLSKLDESLVACSRKIPGSFLGWDIDYKKWQNFALT